jgi:hypothetical protein
MLNSDWSTSNTWITMVSISFTDVVTLVSVAVFARVCEKKTFEERCDC